MMKRAEIEREVPEGWEEIGSRLSQHFEQVLLVRLTERQAIDEALLAQRPEPALVPAERA